MRGVHGCSLCGSHYRLCTPDSFLEPSPFLVFLGAVGTFGVPSAASIAAITIAVTTAVTTATTAAAACLIPSGHAAAACELHARSIGGVEDRQLCPLFKLGELGVQTAVGCARLHGKLLPRAIVVGMRTRAHARTHGGSRMLESIVHVWVWVWVCVGACVHAAYILLTAYCLLLTAYCLLLAPLLWFHVTPHDKCTSSYVRTRT